MAVIYVIGAILFFVLARVAIMAIFGESIDFGRKVWEAVIGLGLVALVFFLIRACIVQMNGGG